MLTNATITQLRSRTGASVTGAELLTEPVSMELRCLLDAPSDRQSWQPQATVLDGDQVVFVEHGDYAPALSDRLTITPDTGAAVTGQVMAIINRVATYIGHYELLLRRATP